MINYKFGALDWALRPIPKYVFSGGNVLFQKLWEHLGKRENFGLRLSMFIIDVDIFTIALCVIEIEITFFVCFSIHHSFC